MFAYHKVLNKTFSRELDKLVKYAVRHASDRHLSVDPEDVASELYMVILARPELLEMFQGKAMSIIKGEATKYVSKLKAQEGGFFTSPESLVYMLKLWRTEGLPNSVESVLYGPVFRKAAKGEYLAVIQDAYWDGLMPPSRSAKGQQLRRAVERLAEVLSGVMVQVKSMEEVEEHEFSKSGEREDFSNVLGGSASRQSWSLADRQDGMASGSRMVSDSDWLHEDDDTFRPSYSLYACVRGHRTKVTLATQGPQRLGMANLYGFRNCKCGEVLELV